MTEKDIESIKSDIINNLSISAEKIVGFHDECGETSGAIQVKLKYDGSVISKSKIINFN